MIDLKDTTFIIPIRIESDDRLRNVITVCCFLLDNFDCRVIIKEVDSQSIFSSTAFPQIKEYVEGSIDNLQHIFEESNAPLFHRQKVLNEMIDIVDTKVVVNYDCDVLLPVDSYIQSQKMIVDGKYDVVYPYGFGNWQKQIFADDELVSEFLSNDCDYKILEKKCKEYDAQYGHVQFFDKDVYISGGMENENFRAYAPEDKERFYRFTTLGYNVGRIDNYLYHLEHSRGDNSWFTNPHMQVNINEWEKIQSMNKEQLEEYYSSQKYLKKYRS